MKIFVNSDVSKLDETFFRELSISSHRFLCCYGEKKYPAFLVYVLVS